MGQIQKPDQKRREQRKQLKEREMEFSIPDGAGLRSAEVPDAVEQGHDRKEEAGDDQYQTQGMFVHEPAPFEKSVLFDSYAFATAQFPIFTPMGCGGSPDSVRQ
ncbi:hypothetical protein [Paenibacillus sp. UNC496MF]|uniref:hypothetical protein n=1 Tax=Paenibacillus sp. UNC496MF TaxID=1502753 RepID=UPI00210E00CA|nr:hypothetical protein [Paenibacillus sp. UNC496MF]